MGPPRRGEWAVPMYEFGPFTLDAARRTLTKNGRPVSLTFKCLELLVTLVSAAGKPLSKQQLLDAVWRDLEASDATLAQHIFLLRRALREDGRVWIETVPNTGYCFAGHVTETDAGDGERARAVRMYAEGALAMRDIGTERALRFAIDLCTRSLALDDSIAGTYALRASCWRLLAESMLAQPLPCLESAKADADAALSRDSQLADARMEAALCAALLDHDAAAARRQLDIVSRLRPDHPRLAHARVWFALMDGNVDEALRVSAPCGGTLHASALYMARRFGAARAIFDGSAERESAARLMRGACRLFEGDLRSALDDFAAIYHEEAPTATPAVHHYALGLYIYALAKSGGMRIARERARSLEKLALTRYVSPTARAVAQLAIGEADRAIDLLAQARERCDPWSAYLAVDPVLDELREDPRFRSLTAAA
jgi:DNA-binding winged helix-turn-helix (wHTH) protein